MAYKPVEQRNQTGAGIQPKSINGYVPVSARTPAVTTPEVLPTQTQSIGGYVPVDQRGADFKPAVTTPVPSPVVEKPAKKPFGQKVADAIDRPDPKTYSTNTKENFKKFLPSSIVESLPFGIGAAFKQIHDIEEYQPEIMSHFDYKDMAKALPGVIVDTAKGFVKAPISGALNVAGITGKKVKFNIPGLGEVSNAQYKTAERVANGEDPVVVALEEGSNAILDTLFFASLATKPFQPRHVTTAKIDVPAEMTKMSGFKDTAGPKSFRLYEPATQSNPLSPEFITKAQSQGVDFGPNFDPSYPTYFKTTFKPSSGAHGVFTGEVIQIKPSYFTTFKNLFKPKTKLPSAYEVTPATGKTPLQTDNQMLDTSGRDYNRAIEVGDMPMEKVYKDVQGHLQPEMIPHLLSDLAGKLDTVHKGLGDAFKAKVDLSNPTVTNIDTQAQIFLNNYKMAGPTALSGSILPILTPAQIEKVPKSFIKVIKTQEVKTQDIEKAVKNPIIENPPAPAPQVGDKKIAVNGVPLQDSTASPTSSIPIQVNYNELAKSSKNVDEFLGKLKVDDPFVSQGYKQITEFFNKQNNISVPKVTEKKIADPRKIQKLEGELKTAYKQYPESESVLNEVLTKLDLAEAGKRIFDTSGVGTEVTAVPSSFPEWIPEGLRTRKSLDALREVIQNIETISYPTRSNAVAKRLLVNEMLSHLDSRLGIDTSGIRGDIMKEYGHTQESNSGNAGGSKPAGRGSATAERGKIEEKKKADNADRIDRLKLEIKTGQDFDGRLTDKQIEEKKAELADLEGGEKSQKEVVKESLKNGAKSIKEVSQETKIKEPNIRRILGVGAKEGTFERVDKGVYVLSKNGEDMAYVETGDATESLPRLAKEGFKADMVFLDIPYDTPAVKGGSRGVNYNLISLEQFDTILDAVTEIARTENSPVIHMFSQAESGMKAMTKYNDLFLKKGFIPVGRGEYQKTYKDGKPVAFPTVKGSMVTKPEGILVFTKSGKLDKNLENLNFRLVRPNGYQTEKPAEMLKAMIEMTTEEGDVVLDPFAGSGVTGAEAVKVGRKAYLIEKDAKVAEEITQPRVKKALAESNQQEKPQLPPHLKEVARKYEERKKEFQIEDVTPEGYGPEAPAYKGGSENADVGVFVDGNPVELGNMDKIRPIEFPELVDLARDLMGNAPFIKKMNEAKRGFFRGQGPEKSIFLNPEIFKDPEQAAKTLAHEIGHLVDYLPDDTLARGNLIGRLKTLRGFMAETFGKENTLLGQTEGKFSDSRRQEIKNRATKDVLASRGLKFGDMFGDKITKAEKKSINEEINARTREAVNELLDKEGFIKNKDIKKELTDVTNYWRPYDIAKSDASYRRYRNSSKELYADALSMLFNTPGTLERMAPTFYKEFFDGLDKKPAVFNAYFEIQELLGGDRATLLERRRSGVRGMFEQGDMKAAEIQRTRLAIAEARRKDFWFQFKFNLVDKNFALIDRVNALKKQGKYVSDDENPIYYLEERNYLGGKIKAFMEKNVQPVYKKLQENGISWTDFGEALFYDRIRNGDRSDVANPRGITLKASEELLQKMYDDMGKEKAEILAQSMEDFRDGLKTVTEEAFEEGLYKPEMHAKMAENPAYATFQVLDYIELGMTSKIHKSIGTLKDVANPADASLLKTISTIRAIERNKVTRSVVEFLQKSFPEDILDAKVANTPKGPIPQESKLPYQELVTYMKEGKVKGFYVDPYIQKSIDNENIGHTISILRTMNSALFRPLFITYNPGFQAFNFIRDFKRFWKNTPDMTFARAIKRYSQAVPTAKARAFGKTDNELLQKMEADQILSISYNQLIDGADVEDKQIETILKASGIDSFQKEVKYKALQPFVKVLDFIKEMGDFVETLPKVAGYLEFSNGGETEISREQKSFIRKYIGSPDFLAGGYWKPVTNEIFLFSNSITQGIRADVDIATDPKTRGGYWYKTAKMDILPKLLMYLASIGVFGLAVKSIMDNESEYDKTNYLTIPLGFDEKGKAVYFRVPQDESGRLIGGIAWKLLNSANNKQSIGKDLIDIGTFTGGQLPSLTPTITSAVATGQFIAGQNPYDWFRNREVLTDDQMKAGGMYAAKPFGGWLFNQAGGGVFYQFQQGVPREKSGTEKFFNLPVVGNIAGRFVKVSNYGKTEKLNEIKAEVQSEQAKKRIDESTVINKYINEAQGARDDKSIEALTKENSKKLVEEVMGTPQNAEDLTRAKNIIKKYQVGLAKGESDPNINALISAVTNEEKGQLINEFKKTMTKQEFNKTLLTALKYKIITQDAIIKASKSANNEK